MATLSYIKIIKDKHLLRLGIAEGEECAAYTVTESVYADIGRPLRGESLDGESLLIIKRADSYYKAKKKALSLLAYADNSERSLAAKLRRAGFPRDIAEEAVREMVGLGYINEEASLERLIASEANVKLHGPGKILPHLSAKGYSSGSIKRVLTRLVESGEIDLTRNAKALVDRKLGADPDREERLELLYKYGYKIRD